VIDLFEHADHRPSDDALWDQTIQERDNYHEWADKLADGIATHFGIEIGEHSSDNNPWAIALDTLACMPDAAQLPRVAATVPEGYALVPIKPDDAMQTAGAQAVRMDTTVINKIWTANAVFRAMVAAASPAADSQDERAAFEADYAIEWNAAMTENGWNGGYTADDVKALREGNTYGEGRDYLNARWEGWQAHAASPATATRKGGEPVFVNLEGLRAKLLAPRETFRDDHGWLAHPDVPVCDEGTRVDKFLEAFGIETRFRSMESDLPDLHERWCDEGLDDCSEWTPTRPEGDGWLLFEIYDTEDGPYAMFGRDLFEAENARKREAHRAARATRNQPTGEAAE
jgi:hypothetical protein